jgi:hypothetical protein
MNRLDVNNKLFKVLKQNPPNWWIELKNDKEVYFEIRKDNSIDVYYNGGNIITGLKHNGKRFSGKIHYKYLLPEKSEYINYDFGNILGLKKTSIELFPINSFDVNTIKRIKANISRHYPANSEKGIQARFINKTGFFIDSEFAYNYSEKIRIDLIWIDISNKKIIPVELKTIGDSRLFDGELTKQLAKYERFLIRFNKNLSTYYSKLFQIKKDLDILPQGLKQLSSLSGFITLNKALLLLGDCNQKWINNNAKDPINKSINNVAIGAYYFGKPKYGCDLLQKTKGPRYIF